VDREKSRLPENKSLYQEKVKPEGWTPDVQYSARKEMTIDCFPYEHFIDNLKEKNFDEATFQ